MPYRRVESCEPKNKKTLNELLKKLKNAHKLPRKKMGHSETFKML